jgi:hypothetical protein
MQATSAAADPAEEDHKQAWWSIESEWLVRRTVKMDWPGLINLRAVGRPVLRKE